MSELRDAAKEVIESVLQGNSPGNLVGCYKRLFDALEHSTHLSSVIRLTDSQLNELLEINYSDNDGSVNLIAYARSIMDRCNIPEEGVCEHLYHKKNLSL